MKENFLRFNLEGEPEDEFEENEEEDEEDLGTCECNGCGCDAHATTTDDAGVPVCEECKTFMVTDGGDVFCGRMELGTRCHVCRKKIRWGSVITGNRRYGSCDCGSDSWTNYEAGCGWGSYRYKPPEREE